ncbi:MAG: alpha/beta hydrolase [Halioglobus sp.]|nr:alpha/beta hydrolase [Halioglobus sp.]MCB1708459.1 alpha/beta hydrolase [Halioglobus sp.]MCP5121936.1 alpha/beta hydrolase [Pseudomonadales bacterium]MCP5192525.1 alpha/beta hydrolase [Pseudomonadales bacterium]
MTRAQPKTYQVTLPDVALQVTEWPGESDPVLLLHATGFHSRCWDSIARRMPGVHIYAVDVRFHGGSDRHGEVDWLLMASDIEVLLDQLDLNRVVGVGHSMGGYLMAYVGACQLRRFRQLVLIDPVILPRQLYAQLFVPVDSVRPADSPVSRRKNQWRDAGEMYERFRDRPPFSSWQDQVLRDYCDYALREVPQESALQLACDPLHEAAIYLRHQGNEAIYELLPRLTIPVTVLRAPPDPANPGNLAASPTWPGLAGSLPDARELYLPGMSHFIPMEDPALVARIIREALDGSWGDR